MVFPYPVYRIQEPIWTLWRRPSSFVIVAGLFCVTARPGKCARHGGILNPNLLDGGRQYRESLSYMKLVMLKPAAVAILNILLRHHHQRLQSLLPLSPLLVLEWCPGSIIGVARAAAPVDCPTARIHLFTFSRLENWVNVEVRFTTLPRGEWKASPDTPLKNWGEERPRIMPVDTPGPKLCPNIASIKQRTPPPAIDGPTEEPWV